MARVNLCESLSHVQLFAAPWTVALQAPLSMEFSSQDYGSGQLPQGIFPTQGLNPGFPHCRKIFYRVSQWGRLSIQGECLLGHAKGLVTALSFPDSVNYLCTLKTISPKECHPWTSVTEKCHLSRCCRKDQVTLQDLCLLFLLLWLIKEIFFFFWKSKNSRSSREYFRSHQSARLFTLAGHRTLQSF